MSPTHSITVKTARCDRSQKPLCGRFWTGKWIISICTITSNSGSYWKNQWWKCWKCFRQRMPNKEWPNPRGMSSITSSRTVWNLKTICTADGLQHQGMRATDKFRKLCVLIMRGQRQLCRSEFQFPAATSYEASEDMSRLPTYSTKNAGIGTMQRPCKGQLLAYHCSRTLWAFFEWSSQTQHCHQEHSSLTDRTSCTITLLLWVLQSMWTHTRSCLSIHRRHSAWTVPNYDWSKTGCHCILMEWLLVQDQLAK